MLVGQAAFQRGMALIAPIVPVHDRIPCWLSKGVMLMRPVSPELMNSSQYEGRSPASTPADTGETRTVGAKRRNALPGRAAETDGTLALRRCHVVTALAQLS